MAEEKRTDLDPYEAEVELLLRQAGARLDGHGDTANATKVRHIRNTYAAPGEAAEQVYDLLLGTSWFQPTDPLLQRLRATIPWRDR